MPVRAVRSGNGVLADKAVDSLEAAIVTGALRAGERLSEQSLAAEFGIGRGPLREAIRTLEGRRLLERVPYVGVRVVCLTPTDFEQLMVVREALEGMASRQAAEQMTLPETRRLRLRLAEFDERIAQEGVGGAYVRGTRENDFHVQIVRGSRNPWLEDLLCRNLYSLIRIFRFRSANVQQRAAAAIAEHYEILDAIERRDPERAEILMRTHIARARANLMSELEDQHQKSAEQT